MRGHVTDGGVVLANGRTLTWDQVYGVDWTSRQAHLATVAGVVRVSRADGERAEHVVSPHLARTDEQFGAEAADRWAEWADAGAGRAKRWRPDLILPFTMGLFVLIVLTTLADAIRAGGDRALAALLLSAVTAWILVQAWRMRPMAALCVDATGLRSGLGARLPWSEIRDGAIQPVLVWSSRQAEVMVLLTRAGRRVVKLNGYVREVRRVLAAALAARRCLEEGDSQPSVAWAVDRPGCGLCLDADGLLWMRDRDARHFAWAELPAPGWGPEGAEIKLGGQPVPLWRHFGGERLARELDCRVNNKPGWVDARGALLGSTIERWLGVPPGGVLRCGAGVLPIGLFGLAAGLLHVSSSAPSFELLALMLAMVAFWVWRAHSVGLGRSVSADAVGLVWQQGRRRRRAAWAEVTAVHQQGRMITIQLASGGGLVFMALSGRSKRLLGAARQVVAARQEGVALPSQTPLADTALSHASEDTDPTELRGLSRTDAPD